MSKPTVTELQLPESDSPFASYAPGGSSDTTRLNPRAADDAAREFCEMMIPIGDACLDDAYTYVISDRGRGCGYLGCDTEKEIRLGDKNVFDLLPETLTAPNVVAALLNLRAPVSTGKSHFHLASTAAALKTVANRWKELIPDSHLTDEDSRLGFATLNFHVRPRGGALPESTHVILVVCNNSRCGRMKNAISAAKNGSRDATNGTLLLVLCGEPASVAMHQHVSPLLAQPAPVLQVANRAPYEHLSVPNLRQQLRNRKAQLRRLRLVPGEEKPQAVKVKVAKKPAKVDDDVVVLSSDDDSEHEHEHEPEREVSTDAE